MMREIPDFIALSESLKYLHVDELKFYCDRLELSIKGKKMILIDRIIHFIKTGEKIESPNYPRSSCVKKNSLKELKPDASILKGAYKNDLKTRLFFKSLVGEHFHFTAFGIDWLENRWMLGLPPTYQEFADMWQKEYTLRKENRSNPKEEWAYINFVKNYLILKPSSTLKEILKQWNMERNNHKNKVEKFFIGIL